MSGRELLLYLSIKYEGDYQKLLDAITAKEKVKEEDVIERIKDVKCKYLTILDEEYPDYLKHVYKPPIVLYYYGDISLLKAKNIKVAVVGSREASTYGIDVTKNLVTTLSKHDRIIVSGLARGIDAVAHRTCIDNKAKTIAVLGSGIDYPYPNQNKDLYEIIKKDHLIISEYPGTVKPNPSNFPDRNRIVAGLCDKLLVTEGYKNSGTCITAMYALQLGKDILVVPYPFNQNSCCNKLIQDGAFLIDSEKDVLDFSEKKY